LIVVISIFSDEVTPKIISLKAIPAQFSITWRVLGVEEININLVLDDSTAINM